MERVWRIELLGTLKANREGQSLTRFRTRRVASLLAYLAFYQRRVHSRDEIADMLWPEADLEVSRRNLRQALSSLRHALEPAPLPQGSVVLSIHDGIQLNPETLTTDVAEFLDLVQTGRRSNNPTLLRQAIARYSGELLPGFNDDWVTAERIELEDVYLEAVESVRDAEPPTPLAPAISSPSPERGKNVLPIFSNRYFGRTEEIQRICDFLEDPQTRLVTILGPAGVGKTRLSVQCAGILAERQNWNIYFVPLADHFNPAEIFEAVLTAIDPRHSSSAEVERISELTEGKPTLLVLDNLEQIADDAGIYVAQLLQAAPHIQCLASSRQPLQIGEEQLVPIEPLPLPTDEVTDSAALSAVPSVQLFIDRCQALRPDMQLNDRNAEAIAALCARLDGLPLAIEIAARLSNSFSPAQMVHHLPPNLTDLTTNRRDVPARHKSLRAAIDWSFDSLDPELQRLFQRLCVFRGGFTLAAMAEICSGNLASIQSLLDRSLVRSQPAEDSRDPRYSLLAVFREYGEEQLSSEAIFELKEAHAEFYVGQAPPARPFANTAEQTSEHLAIELDYDNFTTAIEHSLSAGKLDRCVRLLGILSTTWLSRGPKATERRLIREIAERKELAELTPELQVQLQRMLGTVFIRSGRYDTAYAACTQAVEIAAGNTFLLATCYSGLSVCAGYLGRMEECLTLNKKVLELAGTDHLILAERSHLGIGSVLWNCGKLEEANASFNRAREISEQLRGGEPDALIVVNQARTALDLGKSDDAIRLAEEAIRISRRLHDEFTLAVALTVLSRHHWLEGRLDAAVATNLEALERCRQGDFLFWILRCLRTQALLWTSLGRYREAATLLAATNEASSSERSVDAEDERRAISTLKKSLSNHQFETAWARGLGMDRAEAIRMAVAD